MSSLGLTQLRACFEGAVPSPLATCSPDGIPNVTYLSQVQYVDDAHVATTFQFFNKTRQNILSNPKALLKVTDPHTGASYRLRVHYLRTEAEGPLFERMKAKLAGIASHTGMADVFKLLGADIYRVEHIEALTHAPHVQLPAASDHLPRLREITTALSQCRDLDELLERTLGLLATVCGIAHTMLLKLDESGTHLFTIASRGYGASGVGSEIPIGHGVIGVAARERAPIRISHMTSEYIYGKAVRERAAAHGMGTQLETAIPMPGLPESRSQLAVPILVGSTLYGVLYVESQQDLRFTYDDEDMLQVLANQVGWMAHSLARPDIGESPEDADAASPDIAAATASDAVARPALTSDAPLLVRYFRADHSVFLDQDYLIKGVAGAIFWKLVQSVHTEGRDHFTNRELRLAPDLTLPDIADNLEARLVLLQRRLAERSATVRMVKTGRGRFQLQVSQPLRLQRAD